MRPIARRAGIAISGALLTLGAVAVPSFGVANPSGTGQPSVECEDSRPGNASGARGSAFNEDGIAGTRYAGEQPQNSRNSHSVSQYDVACFQVSQR
ncbi:adenylate cyclase [Streptomyces piniterrae]|uniref:Adenylate cyclase n=1 Tax=Streptomyces piniterrae TaxID=2571125 RepID=A0A4U0NWY8_9ACTN|nr:adenylate cyclase [Streptomyces piniterrae]TJZ58672.1 adenylate cyclase [Streptomyces piniterrae]